MWELPPDTRIAMAQSQLSEKELDDLIASVIQPGGAAAVSKMMETCHEFQRFGSNIDSPHQLYFHKNLAYAGFDLQLMHCGIAGNSIAFADFQFKRKTVFPAPYVNRSRTLVRRLLALLGTLYDGQPQWKTQREDMTMWHFGASRPRSEEGGPAEWWYYEPEDWGSECVVIDEPSSAGQGSEFSGLPRNDFVLLRFYRNARSES